MERIIDPVSKELLKRELTPDRMFRHVNHGHNILYIVDNSCAPNVVREIGRLREIAFRGRQSGSGKECDLDEFDIDPSLGARQLVLWAPREERIVGAYRFLPCDEALKGPDGQPLIPTAAEFSFSESFLRDYLPRTLELSRSFVSTQYQAAFHFVRGIFALDNLFDGVASLVPYYKGRMQYFLGRMGISASFPADGRDMLLYFLEKHFGSPEAAALAVSKRPVKPEQTERWEKTFKGDGFKADYRILKSELRKVGAGIPPLVNTYMKLSPGLKYLGAAVNDAFSGDIECCILLDYNDIRADFTAQHTK